MLYNSMFFRPDGAWAGDAIPYQENGTYYIYYLNDPRCYKDEYAEKTTWHLFTTEDFRNFTYHGESIERGTDDKPNKNAYTGSLIKDKSGTYHAFYTAFNGDIQIDGKSVQSVMKASGPDPYHLKTDPDWIFTADGIQYEEFDWRDPFVFYDEETECYKMLLAARKKNSGDLRGGCIALCTSKDLIHWQYEKPFYDPKRYVTMECPEVFQWGKWYYLVFSTFSDRFCTHYRKSISLDGPWEIPVDDVFDTRANYAIKTAGDEKKRYAFGWIASKKGSCDDGPWEWGGTMDVLQLKQNENGDLSVIPTEGNDTRFRNDQPLKGKKLYNCLEVTKDDGTILIPSGGELGALLYDIPGEKFEWNITVDYSGNQEFGLALHVDEDLESGYFLRFFPKKNSLAWDLWPRTRKPGRYQWQIEGDRPYQIETERYLQAADQYRIRVMKEDTICAVYVNEQIVLSTRMYDHSMGKAGIFVTQDPLTVKHMAFLTE